MESSNSTTTPQPPPQPTATIVALPPPSPAPPLGTRASTRSNNNNNDFTTIPLVANDDNKNNIPDTSNDAALAAALAAQEEQEALLLQQLPSSNNNNTTNSNTYRHATASFPWQYDDARTQCHGCGDTFNLLNRRHHCRLCGHVFCHHCTDQKALLPPSQIVLTPQRRPTTTTNNNDPEETRISFTPNEDPDRMLTYYAPTAAPAQQQSQQQQQPMQLLYGQGLEERFHLARAPQRVCRACYRAVQPLQLELRHTNSHCRRYNSLDPSDPLRRHFNSPLAFTLGHEIRKAAYTLHNLLPQPRRRLGALVDHYDNSNHYHNNNNNTNTMWQSEVQECQQNCRQISFNGSDWDGVRIPARLLEQAKGLAVVTTIKGGFGVAGIEFGTGLVVARRNNGNWSAPSAIQMVSVAWGLLLGAQVTDHVFVLMTDDAVASLLPHQAAASVQLGVDVAVAVGPLGRSLEGDWHVTGGGSTNTTNNNPNPTAAPSIYTYSLSKGLYAGVSLDGKIVTTRHDLNETFYGRAVTPAELWHHEPQPPAAQPLYEALQRCHVYATSANTNSRNNNTSNNNNHQVVPESSTVRNEYGEVDSRQWRGGGGGAIDAPSVANMSDITDF